MNAKRLSNRALDVIDQYMHFKAGGAICSVPYFNNKTARARAALRTFIGKGSPKDIFDETQSVMIRKHIPAGTLAGESLKRLLVDNGLGIDCSALAYYVLNAENEEHGNGKLDRHLRFVNCAGLMGKIRCSLRPVENCDVSTLAHDKNSRIVALNAVSPGDFISMLGGPDNSDRDHILIVHQAEYQNFAAVKIRYSHAVAYPDDGLYGSGVKQGEIEIVEPAKGLLDQIWKESGSTENAARILDRARSSKTELRRLRAFS